MKSVALVESHPVMHMGDIGRRPCFIRLPLKVPFLLHKVDAIESLWSGIFRICRTGNTVGFDCYPAVYIEIHMLPVKVHLYISSWCRGLFCIKRICRSPFLHLSILKIRHQGCSLGFHINGVTVGFTGIVIIPFICGMPGNSACRHIIGGSHVGDKVSALLGKLVIIQGIFTILILNKTIKYN